MDIMIKSEVFPNANHLFEQAFAALDPVPALLCLMKEHPNFSAIHGLVMYYFEAVEKDPRSAPALASVLASLAESPDAPTSDFGDLVNDALANLHFKFLDDENKSLDYGPQNSYLLDSLLSGLSLKHGFSTTPDMCAAIELGLKMSEVGCGELLHGVTITTDRVGRYKRRPEKVAEMLKAQKKAGIVKDPRAIQVLELAISHAETGFNLPENNRDDVWNLLFPIASTSSLADG